MEEKTFYQYKVIWCNEYDEEEPWCKVTTKGLLIAASFTDAVDQVEKSFDAVDTVEISAINDCDLLDYEDLLLFLAPKSNTKSTIGPQLITALEDAINMEGLEDDGLEGND